MQEQNNIVPEATVTDQTINDLIREATVDAQLRARFLANPKTVLGKRFEHSLHQAAFSNSLLGRGTHARFN